jgi:hypothetical protein
MKLDVEGFSQVTRIPVLMLRADCSLFALKPARSSPYLPLPIWIVIRWWATRLRQTKATGVVAQEERSCPVFSARQALVSAARATTRYQRVARGPVIKSNETVCLHSPQRERIALFSQALDDTTKAL